MSGIYGMNIKMSIFGESHGASIGLVIDGLPPGLALDTEQIAREMARRAPGKDKLSTPRKEADSFQIQSGFFNGYTTGTPLCAIIANSDQHSKDYSILKDKMRPGHADYAGFVHYHGYNDYRGGGHFSGRLTAPLVFMGAVAKQALAQQGITVGAHILRIADIKEENFNPMGVDDIILMELSKKSFCVLDDALGEKMQQRILAAKAELNPPAPANRSTTEYGIFSILPLFHFCFITTLKQFPALFLFAPLSNIYSRNCGILKMFPYKIGQCFYDSCCLRIDCLVIPDFLRID